MRLKTTERVAGASSLFKNKSFVMYWLSYLFSALGDAIYFFVIPWSIKELTGSGTMMGTFLLTVGVPRVVLMLFGGVAVDRFDGRRIMILSDLLRATVLVGMLIIMILDLLNMKLILGLGFIFGVLDAFYWPAVTSIRQRIVNSKHYVQSNGLLAGTWQVTVFIGPVIGSFLYQLDNGKTCIIAIIFALISSALTLKFVNLENVEKEKVHTQKPGLREDLFFGLKYISKNHLLLIIIFMMLFANASFNMLQVGLPFLAKSFHATVNEFGMMQSALGAGGLIVSFIFSFMILIKNPSPKSNMIAVSFQGFGLLTLGLTSNYWQAVGAVGLIGVATAIVSSIGPSVTQMIVPAEIMGRVSSIMMIVAQGVVPLAQGAGGWFLEKKGPDALFLVAGIVEIWTGLIAIFVMISVYKKRLNQDQNILDQIV